MCIHLKSNLQAHYAGDGLLRTSIPENINREHVLKALKEIDDKGIPKSRESKTWSLVYNGKYYPPKYVISLANKYANGFELSYDSFTTIEARNYLKRLGFTIIKLSETHDESEEFEEFTVSFERDLEDYLARNIELLEKGLRLVARQKTLPIGRIDLLAEDEHGNLVVIELKSGEADERSLTQLLTYISCLQEQERDREVRGILVAANFSNKVLYATRLTPLIKLKKYKVKFEFEDVN